MSTPRLPEVDTQFDNCVVKYVERRSANSANIISTESCERDPDISELEGPDPSMTILNDGPDAVIMLGGGATCDNAAGQRIVRTSWAVFRNGTPDLGARPAPGDVLCTVWHLDGGGYIYPPAGKDDPSWPADIMTTWWDDCGAEFEGYQIPTAATRRADAAAAAARRCACGNFKTPGHDNCNACRSAVRRPAATAPSPKRRKPAPGEEVFDLTGDD